MTALLSVADALASVLKDIAPLEVEEAPLATARGRVLAAVLTARLTQPPFDASAMDGWAVRSADIAAVPATLAIAGEAAAGHPFSGTVRAGEAVRISTGAPIPDGADTVVIQENARRDGGAVTIEEAAPAGANTRAKGGDFTAGQAFGAAGSFLSPRLIGLAAAMGYATLPVRRKPMAAILPTGDELVPPGIDPAPGQIVSSIPPGLAAMIEAAGGAAAPLGIAADRSDALAAKVREAADADVLVTIGGASGGDHDLIRPVLAGEGFTLDFWRIAMRPGKPLLFGRRGAQRVLGLPGNPVSAFVCARLFLVPLIHALLGAKTTGSAVKTAHLAHDLPKNGPRAHYMRAIVARTAQGLSVSSPPSQDSSLLTALALADCLVVRAPNAPEAKAGDTVEIMDIDF